MQYSYANRKVKELLSTKGSLKYYGQARKKLQIARKYLVALDCPYIEEIDDQLKDSTRYDFTEIFRLLKSWIG